MKKVIATNEAPAAVGPYSQAIAVNNLLFCAGQIPLDPATNELVGEDVTAQAERVCQNIAGVLKANGMTFANVVKTTVFLTDLASFAAMNAVYAKYFTEPFPARSTIQVAGLPRGAQVEIEVTAVANDEPSPSTPAAMSNDTKEELNEAVKVATDALGR
jgi:2-iminobutanoate/2-iminopropanoate deaminase